MACKNYFYFLFLIKKKIAILINDMYLYILKNNNHEM